jgi:phosphate transport system protein
MRHFEQQLEEILHQIVLMGSMVQSMIQLAVKSLVERSETYMAEVNEKEKQVDALQVQIDDMVVQLTALHQPVAADVRFLFIASRATSELERMGDQAINICQNTTHVLKYPALKSMVDIAIMADVAMSMVKNALTSLVDRDLDAANRVVEHDDEVDAFKDQIFRTLLTYMMSDPRTIPQAISLILISRNLERIGDHAVNIAEDSIYLIQGKDVRHGLVKGALENT